MDAPLLLSFGAAAVERSICFAKADPFILHLGAILSDVLICGRHVHIKCRGRFLSHAMCNRIVRHTACDENFTSTLIIKDASQVTLADGERMKTI